MLHIYNQLRHAILRRGKSGSSANGACDVKTASLCGGTRHSVVVVWLSGVRILKFRVRGIPRPQVLDPRTVRVRK